MRVIAQVFVFCLLIGCSSPGSPPIVAWDFDVHSDDHDQPHGKVWLLVNGERHLITDDPIFGYRVVARNEYKQSQIPENAVSACTAWWAGLGEDMYVTADAHRVVVFRREYGETSLGIPAYSVFQAIPIHLTANTTLEPTATAPSDSTKP